MIAYQTSFDLLLMTLHLNMSTGSQKTGTSTAFTDNAVHILVLQMMKPEHQEVKHLPEVILLQNDRVKVQV